MMTHSDIIITLVRQGYSFTFEYIGEIYAPENRQIVFTKQGFNSTPILMTSLNEASIEKVKEEVK